MDADSTQKPLSVILDEIEGRANKATEGPWRFKRHWGPYNWQGAILYDTKYAYSLTVLPLETCTPEKDATGAFIASARTDVPALVKALRRATQALELLNDGSSIYRSDISIRIELEQITAILNQGRSVGTDKGRTP